MEENWSTVRLGDVVEVLTGFPFKSDSFSDRPGDIRLLRGDNIGQGQLRWRGVKRWQASRRAEAVDYELKVKDVVLAMDRPWIEAGLKYAVVRPSDIPSLLVQRVACLRTQGSLTQEFVELVIADPRFTQHVRAVQTGTAVPHISSAQIQEYSFALPAQSEQHRITQVLGVLREKAESTLQIAETLDKVAAALFKAQFVDFLGHEDLVETEIGSIPRGWHVRSLGDVANVRRESIHPQDVPDQILEHYSFPAFDSGRAPEITAGASLKSAKLLVDERCVLTSKLNPARKRVWWPIPSGIGLPVCSPEFVALEPKVGVPHALLYAVARFHPGVHEYIVSHATGTTGSRQRVRPAEVLSARFAVPPSELLEKASQPLAALFAAAEQLHHEAQTLASIRDRLLPKLISGEIRVPQDAGLALEAS